MRLDSIPELFAGILLPDHPKKYPKSAHISTDFISECLFSFTFATIKYISCIIIL
jgi:hypothetical protein